MQSNDASVRTFYRSRCTDWYQSTYPKKESYFERLYSKSYIGRTKANASRDRSEDSNDIGRQ